MSLVICLENEIHCVYFKNGDSHHSSVLRWALEISPGHSSRQSWGGLKTGHPSVHLPCCLPKSRHCSLLPDLRPELESELK